MRERAREDNLTIFYRKKKNKLKLVFSRLFAVADHEFRQNIVTVNYIDHYYRQEIELKSLPPA